MIFQEIHSVENYIVRKGRRPNADCSTSIGSNRNARRRCFYHADHCSRAHERAYNYDRRKGSGSDHSPRLMVMLWLTSYQGEWQQRES